MCSSDLAGRTETVAAEDLVPGDIVLLEAGNVVPADLRLVEAFQLRISEAALTGESQPIGKSPGARLHAGTLNQSGRLVARVTGVGESTALARIVATVRRAQSSRTNIQRLADRISAIFVPVVVLVAAASGLFWGWIPGTARHVHQVLAHYLWHVHLPDNPWAAAITMFCAVLIVACPCAFILATPSAMVAAIAAARRAFDDGHWAGFGDEQRAKILDTVADILERDKELFARAESGDTAKRLIEARYDIDDVISVFRHFALECVKPRVREVVTGRANVHSQVIAEPVGVVAMVTPWNYPLLQASWKVAPAIAAGATLQLGGAETIDSLTNAGTVSLANAGSVLTTGATLVITSRSHEVWQFAVFFGLVTGLSTGLVASSFGAMVATR